MTPDVRELRRHNCFGRRTSTGSKTKTGWAVWKKQWQTLFSVLCVFVFLIWSVLHHTHNLVSFSFCETLAVSQLQLCVRCCGKPLKKLLWALCTSMAVSSFALTFCQTFFLFFLRFWVNKKRECIIVFNPQPYSHALLLVNMAVGQS